MASSASGSGRPPGHHREYAPRPVLQLMTGKLKFAPATLSDLHFQPIDGDNHCMFRAAASVISRRIATDEDVMLLRQLCVEHVAAHPELLAFQLDRGYASVAQYRAAMLSSAWGGNPELQIIANLTGYNFIIATGQRGNMQAVISIQPQADLLPADAPNYGRFTGVLQHDAEKHYNLYMHFDNSSNPSNFVWEDSELDALLSQDCSEYPELMAVSPPRAFPADPSAQSWLPEFRSMVATGSRAAQPSMALPQLSQQMADVEMEDGSGPAAGAAAASSSSSSAAESPPPVLPPAVALVFGAEDTISRNQLIAACKDEHPLLRAAVASPGQVAAGPSAIFPDWSILWSLLHKDIQKWLSGHCARRSSSSEAPSPLSPLALCGLRLALGHDVDFASSAQDVLTYMENGDFLTLLQAAKLKIDLAAKRGRVPAVIARSQALWTPQSSARSNSAPFVLVLQDPVAIATVLKLVDAKRQLAEKEEEEELANQPPGKDDEADRGPVENLPEPALLEPAAIQVATAAQAQLDSPPPPLFHATQEALARRLIDAFRSRLGADWSRFTGVDFRIFVPAFNQLLLQTIARAHRCGVMPADGSDGAKLYAGAGVTKKEAKQALREHSHVWSYVLKNNHVNNEKLEKLRAEAKSNPTVLYLLIADEAEWGCNQGGPNDQFVNDPILTSLPNVIVLLVTATPYALLTTHSRLPLDVEPFAYQMACGPQQLGITDAALADKFQANTILINDKASADHSTLQSLSKQCLPPSIMQPLEHVIPWFSPPAVVDGELVILRSNNRLLLVSASKRLNMASGNAAAAQVLQEIEQLQVKEWPCDVSRDSAFDTDRFRLLVDKDTPLRWKGNERPLPINVCLQHVLTGLFLAVGAASTNELHRKWSPAVRQAVLAPASASGRWLELQMHERGSYFELSSPQADGRVFSLWTHTALGVQDAVSGSALSQQGLYFVDTQFVGEKALSMAAVPLDHPPTDDDRRSEALGVLRKDGHDCEFFFAPVQHGYRSLDTYIASSARELRGARTSKLLRSDPLFHTSEAHTITLQPLQPCLADMRVAWSACESFHKRCSKHTGIECKVKEHRLKLGKQNFAGCFDDTQLLLADYVYWMLHFRAFTAELTDASRLQALDKLVTDFQQLTNDTPQAQCPLPWVHRWYSDQGRAMVEGIDAAAPPLDRLRALEIACKHIKLSPAQFGELGRLRTLLGDSSKAADSPDATAFHARMESLGLDVRTETEMVVELLLQPLMHLVRRAAQPAAATASSDPPVRGKMVVVRVRSNKLGYCMHAGLRSAVKLLCDFSPFLDLAVIPDFDEFSMAELEPRFLQRLQWGHRCKGDDGKCTCQHFQPSAVDSVTCTCGHVHHRVAMYEDLLHLPCIVLLNEKGRMGDTFPHSFATMDLRLRGNSRGNLRSVVQELGRMCRYVRPHCLADGRVQCRECAAPYDKDFAYALIGFPLADTLHSVYSLSEAVNNTSFVKSKDISSLTPPKKANVPHPLLEPPYTFCAFKPKDTMYDFVKSMPTHQLERLLKDRLHQRRFLLEAECQIGKTGTYLALFFLLQQEMTERPEARDVWLRAQPGQMMAMDFHPRWAALEAAFVDYAAVGYGKYHLRVAKERLCALLGWRNAVDLQRCLRDWLFLSAGGELAVSQAAKAQFNQSAASRLNNWPAETMAELEQRIDNFYLPIINWDGRMTHTSINRAAMAGGAAAAPAAAASGSIAGAAPAPRVDGPRAAAVAPVKALLQSLLRGPGEQTYLKNPKRLAHIPLSQMWSAPAAPPAAPVRSRVVPQVVSEQAREWRAAVANGSQRPGSDRTDLYYRPKLAPYFAADHPLLRISAPSFEEATRHFKLNRLMVNGVVLGSEVVGAHSDSNAGDLQRWIFTCTYNRAHAAMLDFSTVMLRVDGAEAKPMKYRRVIVVRSSPKGSANSEYDKYVAAWGGEAIIMELPPACNFPRPLEDGSLQSVRTTQEQGGIGFARLCVQLIARQWDLHAVWCLDDNILRFYEMEVVAAAAASGAAFSSSEHKLSLRPVPFGHIMRKMEQLLDDNAAHNKTDGVEEGSWQRYGMVGCSRSLKRLYQWPHQLLQKSHSHNRCYSAVLLNIRGCFVDARGGERKHPLLFPPRPVWEDIEFQHVLAEGGLRVVRYDRVVHIKRNLTQREPYVVPKPPPPVMVPLQPMELLDVIDSPLPLEPVDKIKDWLAKSHDVQLDSWLDDNFNRWAVHRHSAFHCSEPMDFSLALNTCCILLGRPLVGDLQLWLLVRAADADEFVRTGSSASAAHSNRVSFQHQLIKSCTPRQQQGFLFQWWIPTPQGELAERAVKAVPEGAWMLLRIKRAPPIAASVAVAGKSSVAASAAAVVPASAAVLAPDALPPPPPQLLPSVEPRQSLSVPMEDVAQPVAAPISDDVVDKRKREESGVPFGSPAKKAKSASDPSSVGTKKSGGKKSKHVAPTWDFLLDPLKAFFKQEPGSFLSPWNAKSTSGEERIRRMARVAKALDLTPPMLQDHFDAMDKAPERDTLKILFNLASNNAGKAVRKAKERAVVESEASEEEDAYVLSDSDTDSDTDSDSDIDSDEDDKKFLKKQR